ncbi:MAG: phage/plasmid primase, P4 family [Clostridiales bacterium]|nr:phage/plasmid primase, P4 family [Clostridiales bacterium]
MNETTTVPSGLESALWCCWQWQERDGKPTKVPINPRTGYGAKPNDRSTFSDFHTADSVWRAVGFNGVGVGLFDGLCAIDIDHCVTVDENGAVQLSDLAKGIVERMDSYTELSPSRTGIHILFYAPGLQWDKNRLYTKNPQNGVEIYISGQTSRYMTFTGAALYPNRAVEERSRAVMEIAERYMVRENQNAAPAPSSDLSGPSDPSPFDEFDDEILLRQAKSAKNGVLFSALWAGDISGYQSPSEADLALCNLLAFWTGKDAERIDRLFRRSGLMREKWDRPQSGTTYGAITIQKAIDGCKEVYDPQGGNGATLKPPDPSDAGNAAVFVENYRGRLIYSDALGWLWWNGQRWERNDHKAMSWATELSKRMLQEAVQLNREALAAQAEIEAKSDETGDAGDKSRLGDAKAAAKAAGAYLKHAKASRNAPKLRNMLDVAKPALVVKADALDADPFSLNTPAGIVDLTSGELHPHDPAALCSQITEASPGNEGAEMWRDFLHTVTVGDSEVERFLQEVAGMSLIGKVYQEGIIIAYGGGRNGKSTFFNALGRVLGDYTGGIDIQVLTTERQNRGASLATLRGKRLIVTGELEEHQRLSMKALKQIAATDVLTIEEKFHQPEDIKPSHSVVLFTNHLPRVGSTDEGTWRRLTVVPFLAVISPDEGIQNYADVLAEQAGGAILSWAIEGAVRFGRNGHKLNIPETVKKASEEYRVREDWLNNFLSERCILEHGAKQPAGELYQAYRTWAGSNGEYIRRASEFDAAMVDKGFHKTCPKNKRTWWGLKLAESASAEMFGNYALFGQNENNSA